MSQTTETDEAASPPLTNYECVREPRPLSREEVIAGREQARENGEIGFYAISREDGYIGFETGSNTQSAKIRVLYVTRDGRRSFTRMHHATERDGEEHDFKQGFNAVLARQPDAGFETAGRSIEGYRDLAARLHNLGGGRR